MTQSIEDGSTVKIFYESRLAKVWLAIQNGADFVLESDEKKKVYLKITKQLKDAFVVALGILDDDFKKKVLYYISVRHFIKKLEFGGVGNKFDVSAINAQVAALIAEAIKGDEVKILTQVKDSDENRNVWELLSEEKVEALRKSNPPHIFIKIMERLLKEAVAEYRGCNLVESKEYSNYPPDYTDDAIERVIDQAEFMM